jgi:hypothetical protein
VGSLTFHGELIVIVIRASVDDKERLRGWSRELVLSDILQGFFQRAEAAQHEIGKPIGLLGCLLVRGVHARPAATSYRIIRLRGRRHEFRGSHKRQSLFRGGEHLLIAIWKPTRLLISLPGGGINARIPASKDPIEPVLMTQNGVRPILIQPNLDSRHTSTEVPEDVSRVWFVGCLIHGD